MITNNNATKIEQPNYDAEKGILYVGEKKKPRKQLRGFIITVAENDADADAIAAGDYTKMRLAPVMAPSEQAALDVIAEQKKIPMTIISYEYLKFQTTLLETLSKTEDIDLLIEQNYQAQMPQE